MAVGQVIGGPLVQGEFVRDEDGYVTQEITYQVETSDLLDGPQSVLGATGLPQPGDIYEFGNDVRPDVYCRLDAKVKPKVNANGGPDYWWEVALRFSNKPDKKRCKDQEIEDPLLEPDRVSGNFSIVTEESSRAYIVKVGNRAVQVGGMITNSAFEQIRGAQAEFDAPRAQVKIEQNVASLDLFLISSFINCCNKFPLWGLPAYFIKLNSISWERKFYGSCYVYYTRSFEFAINPNSWARLILDEGKKALHGKWNLATGAWDLINIAGAAPNPLNPSHYDQYKDKNGENGTCILDGDGKPYVAGGVATAQWWCINDCTTAYIFNGTCAQAKTEATNAGGFMAGPYATEDEANQKCIKYNCYEGYDPATANCTNSQIGQIHVEKYFPVDFLLLGIPTTF